METPAHGLTAATPTTTGTGTTAGNNCSAGLRRSQRPTAGRRRRAPPSPSPAPSSSRAAQQSIFTATPIDPTTTVAAAAAPSADAAQPPASFSAHATKLPKKYRHPAVTASSSCGPASEDRPSSMTASDVSPAPAPVVAAPLILPNLVKMEVSSDCEGHGSNMSRVGAATAAVVDGGYSSSSASDDTPYTSEEEQQQQALSSDRVEFDKDDNAACDSLLRDILGQQDDSGEDDEFLSLLSDGDMNMMIVNPASEGLNDGLVKRELNNTSVVF